MEKNSKHKGKKKTGGWEKGHVPWNKGMKGYYPAGIQKHWFKKGCKVWNERALYSERYDKDGYVIVKVGEKKWKRKHIWIWEKEHGEVPEGHIIIFRDNDKYNFDIDNLKCISRSVNAVINRNRWHTYTNEAKDAMITLAELKIAQRKREKELKNARKRK